MPDGQRQDSATAVGSAGGTGDDGTDATLNELPLMPAERIWGFWDYSAVNIGLAVATWAFLQGAAVAYYVGAVQAIASIVIGYAISVFLVSLAPCLPSAKYGIEQFVGLRSVFGSNGARIVMVVMSTLFAAAWSAVLAIMFGHGLVNVIDNVFGVEISQTGAAVSLLGLVAVALSWLVLARGPVSVESVCRVIAPVLVLIIVGILVMVFTKRSWSELASLPPLDPESDPHTSFMVAIELNIAGGFAWWPNIGNLARLTRGPRAAFWPNWLGLFAASVAAAVVGVFAALALNLEDPTEWMIPLAGVVLGVLALIVIGFANVTAILSQGYASMVALKGGGGKLLRGTPWPVLVAFILGPAAILVFFPSAVYDNYGRFLSWGAILVAPLCAVQIVDFFLLRRGVLRIRDLYLPSARSCYGYWGGVNAFAFASVAAGAATYALLLNPVTYIPSSLFPYTTASIPAFLVAGTLHAVLTKMFVQPLGLGGYDRLPRVAAGVER
ncbi:cytosine permease [Rhodococcus wratislaviensis]|uniref:cytosine permease n=1 Tax=Rhodococcus wratislaviensis TaxID=44752 RepID=UPI00365AFB89